jgi:hypothetical protein
MRWTRLAFACKATAFIQPLIQAIKHCCAVLLRTGIGDFSG